MLRQSLNSCSMGRCQCQPPSGHGILFVAPSQYPPPGYMALYATCTVGSDRVAEPALMSIYQYTDIRTTHTTFNPFQAIVVLPHLPPPSVSRELVPRALRNAWPGNGNPEPQDRTVVVGIAVDYLRLGSLENDETTH